MISERDKKSISDIAKKYKVKKVFLFGSASVSEEGHDIDLAVEGISARDFFKFYSENICFF